jgi:hypothetical protein
MEELRRERARVSAEVRGCSVIHHPRPCHRAASTRPSRESRRIAGVKLQTRGPSAHAALTAARSIGIQS